MIRTRHFFPTPSRPLSIDELRKKAPSIFAETPIAGVSSRYRFVSTAEILEGFRAQGWEPVAAREQRVRTAERVGFQMHEIRFSRLDAQPLVVGEARGDILLTNSHDRSSAYKLTASVMRLVCSNGLVVADDVCPRVTIRHSNISREAFDSATAQIVTQFDRLATRVHQWRALSLSEQARTEFAAHAARLRWPEGGPLAPTVLLSPRRDADRGNDLWRTMNVVQEHLLRGGDRYREGFRKNTTRAVSGIAQSVDLNRGIWALAEQFSKN